MDYGRLNRKELQILCKQHGIPANKTNVFMAEALAALPKESNDSNDLATDTRGTPEDALAPASVDDLSSQLARNTISCDLGSDDTPDALATAVTKPRSKIGRKPSKMKPITDIYYAQPELPIKKMEVTAVSGTIPESVDISAVEQGALYAATDVEEAESGSRGRERLKQYAKRGHKVEQQPVDVVMAGVQDSSPTAIPENKVNRWWEIVGNIVNAEIKTSQSATDVVHSPVAEAIAVPVQPPVKKSAKGRKTKKMNNQSAFASVSVEADVADIGRELKIQNPDSPAFILPLPNESAKVVESVESKDGDMEDNVSFEFRPEPSSFAEIMSPVRPHRKLDVIDVQLGGGHPAELNVCQHRVKSRANKAGKQCISCESERKDVTIMHEMLDTIDLPAIQEPVANEVAEDNSTSTPVKPSDDKENSIDAQLHNMSIRKLQKEIQKRHKGKRATKGLASRTNTVQSLVSNC